MKDYICSYCFNEVDYLCPSCLKPILPVDLDLSKLIIDSKYVAIDKGSKYYYCWRCRELGSINQTLIKEEDLAKLKNRPEDSMPELTMNLIMINCKPAFLVTVEIKESKKGESL
jgi:hypothetical protein